MTPCSRAGVILAVAVFGLAEDAHNAGDVGAVDVNVQQPHALALPGQGGGQVAGDGGFADAALAAVHADFGADGGEAVGDLSLLFPLASDLLQAGVLLRVGLLRGLPSCGFSPGRAGWLQRAGGRAPRRG